MERIYLVVSKQEVIDNNTFHDSDCSNWRANGQMKTWKRDSNRFRLPLKYGLYNYWHLTELNSWQFHLPGGTECSKVVK